MFCSFIYEQEYNKSVHLLKSWCFFHARLRRNAHENTNYLKIYESER